MDVFVSSSALSWSFKGERLGRNDLTQFLYASRRKIRFCVGLFGFSYVLVFPNLVKLYLSSIQREVKGLDLCEEHLNN